MAAPVAPRPSLRHITGAEPGINLTPLIDIIFILIFFFFLATEIRRDIPNIELDLPALREADAAGEALPKEVAIITVTTEGEVFVNRQEEPVEPERLAEELSSLRSAGTTTVLIRGDNEAPWGLVLDTFRQVQTAGFPSVNVEYQRENITGEGAIRP